MQYRAAILSLSILLAVSTASSAAEPSWQIASPDGKLVVTLALTKPADAAAYPADKARLYYRIEHGANGSRAEALPWSPLGITRDDADFVDGLTPKAQSKVTVIDEAYTLVHGKRLECRSQARQQTFVFANAEGNELEVVFRVSNDGVAFRYHFPSAVAKRTTVVGELTGFRLPSDAAAWMTPYSESTMYTPAYEEYYQKVAVGAEGSKPGWAFPALYRLSNGRWVLLTDAAVDGRYCASRLSHQSPHGVYRIRFPDAAEGWHQGSVEPSGNLPWTLPWRVVMVADSLAGLVESSLMTDLNPPSRVGDASWIKPGRAAWSWWSDHDSPQNYRKLTEFVDLASEMGWEYFLVDANWDLMDNGDVRQLAKYAKQKNVGLWLWYNSGGDHNIVTEKPRGCMNLPEVRKFEFDLLRRWGVAGVKIDFFQSDKQNIMGLYHDILRDAAEKQIMVNFHGCTLPRGWQRTWPHLMSAEAVRGAECYTFAAEFPARAPEHNTIIPFTRNAVGPMDYTPCALSDDKYPHITTNAHELALCVVFESGVLHFADRVSAYRELPPLAKQYLKDVPVVWDETRLIGGEPGHSVVMARRRGSEWYIGAINGQKTALTLSVPLAKFGAGPFAATLIADGDAPRTLATSQSNTSADGALELKLLPYGGAVVRLKPAAAQ
jgi:hypothetical protein